MSDALETQRSERKPNPLGIMLEICAVLTAILGLLLGIAVISSTAGYGREGDASGLIQALILFAMPILIWISVAKRAYVWSSLGFLVFGTAAFWADSSVWIFPIIFVGLATLALVQMRLSR